MAVKERVPRIVRREVHLDGLVGVDDHCVLQNAGYGFAVHLRQFETMPMQVQWMRELALNVFREVFKRTICDSRRGRAQPHELS